MPGSGWPLRRQGRLPAPDRARLKPGERVVGWTHASTVRGATGPTVIATDAALHLPGGTRLAWASIARARWEDPILELLVVEDGSAPRTVRLDLQEPGTLADAVHAMVTGSVVVSERLDLGEGAGALAVARRAGTAVRWTVAFDAGLDPADPALRARADAALTALRTSLGI